MSLICPQCGKVYSLDWDRLAREGRSFVRCNACSQIIALDSGKPPDEKEPDTAHPPPENSASAPPILDHMRRNFKKLYPMPHVILKTRSLLADPEVDLQAVSTIIKTDQALASRILRVTNSAFFGLNSKVTTISHALALLGTRTVAKIIAIVSHSKMLKGPLQAYSLHSGHIWRHSLTVAVASEMLASRALGKNDEEAFLAGLLHDVGKILLNPYLLEHWTAFQHMLQRPEASLPHVESRLLGIDHAFAGSELSSHWNLPDQITTAIRNHHTPLARTSNPLARIVSVANTMATGLNAATREASFEGVDAETLTSLGLTVDDLHKYAGQVIQSVETLEEDTY